MMAATKVASAPVVKDTTAAAITTSGSPYIHAVPLNSTTGFGARYADPAVLPAQYTNSVVFSPKQTVIASTYGYPSIYVDCYKWDNITGFGTKFADPSIALPAVANRPTFNAAGDRIAFALASSPFLAVYEWNDVTGFGTKFADPDITGLPAFPAAAAVAFAPDNKSISISLNLSPFIVTWAWDNTAGFGARYSNPATLPEGGGVSIGYTSASDAIIMSTGIYPAYLIGYPWNSVTGYGSRYADPIQNPNTSQVPIKLSPDGKVILGQRASTAGGGTFGALRFDSVTGYGTRYAEAPLAVGTVVGVDWTKDGKAAIIAAASAPTGIVGFRWDNATGFGAQLTAPTGLSVSGTWMATN